MNPHRPRKWRGQVVGVERETTTATAKLHKPNSLKQQIYLSAQSWRRPSSKSRSQQSPALPEVSMDKHFLTPPHFWGLQATAGIHVSALSPPGPFILWLPPPISGLPKSSHELFRWVQDMTAGSESTYIQDDPVSIGSNLQRPYSHIRPHAQCLGIRALDPGQKRGSREEGLEAVNRICASGSPAGQTATKINATPSPRRHSSRETLSQPRPAAGPPQHLGPSVVACSLPSLLCHPHPL